MPMFSAQIIPMAERNYKLVPIDKIKVLNSRSRDKSQWEDNVTSIKEFGILKPIVLNSRFLEKEGYYDLVCGEGRFLAFKTLGRDKIPAEIINCDKKKALLYSLVENIARVPPDSIWFANELKRMKDEKMPIKEIVRIAGKTETYVVDYIRLVELGEERLIRGVEQKLFPMSFATIIAKSSSAEIQNVLMDAFDSGLVSSANAVKVRNMIEQRLKGVKKQPKRQNAGESVYSLKDLKRDIDRITQEKESFVKQVSEKENRLLTLLDVLNTLRKDSIFLKLLKEENMAEQPELVGAYNL